MLILEQYGVRLVRVQQNDIELIRHWRNKETVANYMVFREHISAEAQQQWFKSINNKFNYYFLIEYENKQVGLINVKNYNPDLGFGEGGIFMWNDDEPQSLAAVFASLCLLNFMLVKIGVCQTSRIRILKDNARAIQYNKMLGYKLIPGQEEEEHQLYELHINDYLKEGAKLNTIAAKLNPQHEKLLYYGEVSDKNMDAINRLLF